LTDETRGDWREEDSIPEMPGGEQQPGPRAIAEERELIIGPRAEAGPL
jgi:hypothetical protein